MGTVSPGELALLEPGSAFYPNPEILARRLGGVGRYVHAWTPVLVIYVAKPGSCPNHRDFSLVLYEGQLLTVLTAALVSTSKVRNRMRR